MNDPTWIPVCRLEDLDVERGVSVLVHGRAVAVFRTHDGSVRALANRDPFSRTGVLAKGLVGTRAGVDFVASSSRRRAFDLDTGLCLDDPAVRISTYDVRVTDGLVEVGRRRTS